jgi:tRNA pseudouridine55 synthase
LTCGILLLDKPLGLSSSGATQRVRRLFGGVKAGHVGSLDPLATGMLPICLGEATKVAGEVLDGAKTYTFRIQLGRRTATGDTEGEVVETLPIPTLAESHVTAVLAGFTGERMQVPPMYSAIKQGGQPLYRLARAGKTVERAARKVVIHALQLLAAGDDWLDCRVRCGKGTYVRVLAEEIATALGTCGHVAVLRRESVEPFAAEGMISLEELEARRRADTPVPLIAAEVAIRHLPAVTLGPEAALRLGLGQAVTLPAPMRLASAGGAAVTVLLFGESAPGESTPGGAARFLGLGLADADGVVRPKRLFVA